MILSKFKLRFFLQRITKKGFTLIELLVVIAIIGLLATMSVVAFSSATTKARDTKRISDIGQIQKALDLYYDARGTFIDSLNCGATAPNPQWCNSAETLTGNHWIRNQANTTNLDEFLKKDPTDPKPSPIGWITPGTYYYFSQGGSNKWYMLVYRLENGGNSIETTDGVTACGGTYYHYGTGVDGVVTVGRNCQP